MIWSVIQYIQHRSEHMKSTGHSSSSSNLALPSLCGLEAILMQLEVHESLLNSCSRRRDERSILSCGWEENLISPSVSISACREIR